MARTGNYRYSVRNWFGPMHSTDSLFDAKRTALAFSEEDRHNPVMVLDVDNGIVLIQYLNGSECDPPPSQFQGEAI